MLPRCNFANVCEENVNVQPNVSSTSMPSFVPAKPQDQHSETMMCTKPTSEHLKTPCRAPRKFSNTFDFDLSSLPVDTTPQEHSPPTLDFGPMIQLAPLEITSCENIKKTDLRIELPVQPTLVVQSPKTPTLSRKLKAVSLDSDSNTSNSPADCLELPRDVFSMPNTPKRQLPKTQLHKFGVRSHSGTNLGLENTTTSSNLSSFGSNQSITGSQTLKTLPEIMTLSDFSQGKTEPVRIKAKGLLERRGSNVSLTIDLCAAEAKNANNHRLNTARSVSNLNLTNIGNDKCRCKTDTKCECTPKRKDCKKCMGNLKKFQKLSTESCLCDENTNSAHCHGYKICQYSRLGCLNYLSYMRRKSLSNENLYLGPSYEFKKAHKKSEYPRNITSQFKNQILSEDFQLHLQNIQYLQTAGNVLSKKQLKESCKQHLKDLHKEFWELPQNFQEKSFVSGSQSKNRYKTILPNEHSRVVLDLGQGQDSSGAEGYINANYIKGADYTETAYIATQGPLPHTTGDMWQMVVQSNAQKVIMLTPIEEKGRIKCELYFPEQQGSHLICGKFKITCLSIYQEKSYCIRTLRIRDTTLPKREAQSYNRAKFCCDKMKQCGIECKKLTKLNATISNELVTKNLSDNVLSQLESNQNSPNHIISPEIQNNNCNNAKFFNEPFGDTVLSDTEYDDDDIFTNMDFKANNRPRVPLRSRDCKFSDDFTDIMSSVVDLETQNVEYNALRLDRSSVDSDEEIFDTDHVVLHYWYQTWPDHNLANTEEILALALDVLNLRCEMESLFTQNSRPSPIFDLNKFNMWKIEDESTDSNKLSCKSQDNHQRTNLASDIDKNSTKSEFKSCIDKLKEKHFSRGQKCVETNSVPIVVHCSAGIGRTGCFLAILNGIQQLKQNSNVDVLAIVCALRLNRGGMVQTAEQYELIHKVLALYGEYGDK